jgi:hypothetical protein
MNTHYRTLFKTKIFVHRFSLICADFYAFWLILVRRILINQCHKVKQEKPPEGYWKSLRYEENDRFEI